MNESNLQKRDHLKTVYALLLLLFFSLSYFLPIGARELIVPDETRYAEIPREMISSGDWVVPRIDGVRYFEKPALGYWVHAVSILLLGENNFAVRLPSGMAVGLTALLIFLLVYRVRKIDDDDKGLTAVLAALIFMSCFAVFGIGNTAVLDSLLSLFLTGSIAAFFFASEASRGSWKERGLLLLSGICCGMAFLTKGFLAFVVPVLSLAPYLAWQRRWKDLFRMTWLPVLSAILVALPWSIWIHLREPDFWNYFFWNEHIRRFLSENAQHRESVWSFLLTAPALFFPWMLAVPAAVPGIARQVTGPAPWGRLVRLSVCWLVLPFLFFSFSSGKLFTYILPCFPPFAILVCFGLADIFEKEWPGRLFQWAVALCAALFVLLLLALVYIQFFGPEEDRLYSQLWKTFLAAGGFLFYVLLCIHAFKSRKDDTKILAFAMAPLLFYVGAHFIIPDATVASKSPGPLLERNRKAIGEDAIVISDEFTVRAVCWYLQRDDVYLLGDAGELSYGFGYEDAAGRLLDLRSAVDLIRRNPGKVVLIDRIKKHPGWRDQLPEPVFRDTSGPRGYEVCGF